MDRRAGVLLGIGFLTAVATIGLVIAGPPAARTDRVATTTLSPSASFPPAMSVADLYAVFRRAGDATSAGEATTLSTIEAGDLVLPTGQVVAADVYFFSEEPFTRVLPRGEHPVQLLSSARDPTVTGDVAAALIRVAPGDPVDWELALVAGQDPRTLEPGGFFGYPVDSGSGCFASPEAVALLADQVTRQAYDARVTEGFFPSDDVADWNSRVEVVLDPASGVNVIAFTSGFGDGVYPSWFGLDVRGEPLVLLTDFGVLDAPAPAG